MTACDHDAQEVGIPTARLDMPLDSCSYHGLSTCFEANLPHLMYLICIDKRTKFTAFIQPAKAYDDEFVMSSRATSMQQRCQLYLAIYLRI